MEESNEKSSKLRIIALVAIVIICIIAIFEAVYVVLFSVDGSLENVTTTVTNTLVVDQNELLKDNFQTIFKNNIISNVDTVNIPKKDNKYNLVYSSYEKIENVSGKYDVDVQIPHINIESDEINKINNDIDKIFRNKVEKILDENNTVENVIYNVKYVAYVNKDILSLVIQCTLKEDNNPQRIIMKTYNYNMTTGIILNIDDLAEYKQLTKNSIENKIKEEIKSQISMEQSLAEAGYTVFNRYLDSEMYKYENISNMFLDEKNNLYIIFAYGNNNNTSELDIVIM